MPMLAFILSSSLPAQRGELDALDVVQVDGSVRYVAEEVRTLFLLLDFNNDRMYVRHVFRSMRHWRIGLLARLTRLSTPASTSNTADPLALATDPEVRTHRAYGVAQVLIFQDSRSGAAVGVEERESNITGKLTIGACQRAVQTE
jgi:hypothetical protein